MFFLDHPDFNSEVAAVVHRRKTVPGIITSYLLIKELFMC